MIYQEFKTHQRAYLVLIGGLISLTLAFLGVWPSRVWQRVVVLMMCFFYFGWGVITHFKTEHLTWEIVLEYLGVSILAGVSIILLTL